MRERQKYIGVDKLHFRITPARAGKTHNGIQSYQSRWDHPRSCGKDWDASKASNGPVGSPPLVRERLKSLISSRSRFRITPARAGKTDSCRGVLSSFQDHPRSCGKDRIVPRRQSLCLGSPPLVRERLIQPMRSPGAKEDHPRSCGKDADAPAQKGLFPGSPPLVRERLDKMQK